MSNADERLLVVTPTFHPEKVGTPHYATDLALELAGRGYQVTVVTNQPYYPEFRRYPGYGRATRRDRLESIEVYRLPTLVPREGRPVWRAASELNLVVQGLATRALHRLQPARQVISISPGTPSVVMVARGLREAGGRLLTIVHDIQTGLISATTGGAAPLAARAAAPFERMALNQSDVVSPLSPHMGTVLARLGVRAPIRPVPLWATVEPGLRPWPAAAAETVGYSGTLGRKQGVDALVELASRLHRDRPSARLVIRGDGSEKPRLAAQVPAAGLDNVAFEPLVPVQQLAEALAMAAVHVVPQLPEGADSAVPSKIFNVLAVGRPVVVTAHPGTPLADLADSTPAVLAVPPGDPDAFAAEVTRLLAHPDECLERGRAGVDYVRRHATRQAAVDRYLELLTSPSSC